MESYSLLLVLVLGASIPAHPMNFSWLKPAASCAARAAYSCGSALAKGAGSVGGSLKEHKLIAGAVAAAGMATLAYKAKQSWWPMTFYDAVRSGDAATVQKLLSAGVDPNKIFVSTGRMPLIEAVRLGHADIVRILLQEGANIEAVDNNGYTPLHWAAAVYGRANIADILLQAGANTEAVNREGDTPLLWAVRLGHADIVRILLRAGANKEAVCKNRLPGYSNLSTALHWAVIRGNAEIVRILVQDGANTEAVDGEGYTPLLLAVYDKEKIDIVRILVQMGANRGAVDSYGNTPFGVAVKRDNADIVSILNQAGANKVAMDKAAQADDIAKVQELITQGAPICPACIANAIGAYNPQEPTVHDQIAKLLLKAIGVRQANRARDTEGKTLLHVAAQQGNIRVASALLHYGADVNVVDNTGNTPLHVASSDSMSRVLMLHGASLGAMNTAGQVPFSAQIKQWRPLFRKWVEEDGKIPELLTGGVHV